MRRNLLHKILLLGLVLVSLTGMARTGSARRATIGVAGSRYQHFYDDGDHHGDVELTVSHHLTASVNRSHVKTGSGSSALTHENTIITLIATTAADGRLTSEGQSPHLHLIFPFHYFW